MRQVQNYTLFDFMCVCVYLCVCWLPACPRSYLFSDVRRQFCLYVLLCMFDSHLVHASRAHTLPRLLSYMPGFRLCVHCSVIIQRGKQPAPDLISCLGSHIEVGKHYQLITVLPASPAFFSPLIVLPREDSAFPCFSVWLWMLRVGAIPCRLLPTCL